MSDSVYRERAFVVAALMVYCHGWGWEAGVADREEEWPCFIINLPTGQVSWHVSREDLAALPDLPDYKGERSEYTTEVKYERLLQWMRQLTQASKENEDA